VAASPEPAERQASLRLELDRVEDPLDLRDVGWRGVVQYRPREAIARVQMMFGKLHKGGRPSTGLPRAQDVRTSHAIYLNSLRHDDMTIGRAETFIGAATQPEWWLR